MRIGIDIMGGDNAPETTIDGVILASKKVEKDTTIVLFGDEKKIEERLKEKNITLDNIEIVHTDEVIAMGDSPTQAFTKKPNSSIVVGFDKLKKGEIEGFASAGSTGAMMVGCILIIKQIEGVLRPTIATPLPTFDGNIMYLLDVGLNIDCKPEVLEQYGLIGSIYAECQGVKSPKIALLNIGEEEEKGNAVTKATHQLMKDSTQYNFIGNIESKRIFTGEVDVVVCDGFTGNIVLKTAEGLYPFLAKSKELSETEFVKGFNYEIAGGTPVLGINSTVIIGHGCSSALAIQNMILQTEKNVKVKLVEKIKNAFKNGKN
ncbi:MAG: phosphate acyltransferase PlsX [Bacteroidetes bacterium]|nr:phosphate acyltransferase PlsX [Bacteroidota bacterium]